MVQVGDEEVRKHLWWWIAKNHEIFEEFGNCYVSHLLREENGFKQHLPEGFLSKHKREEKMYNWVGTVDNLEVFIDEEGQRCFRVMESPTKDSDTPAMTEFEYAFVHYVKNCDPGRYFSFVELGQDINVMGAFDMTFAALKAEVAALPYAFVAARYKKEDSFQVDQAAVNARRGSEPQSSQDTDLDTDEDEEQVCAGPARKRRRETCADQDEGQVCAEPAGKRRRKT